LRDLAKSALPEPAACREAQKGYECSTSFETCAFKPAWGELTAPGRTSETCVSTFDGSRSPSGSFCRTALPPDGSSCLPAQSSVPALQRDRNECKLCDGSTVLVIQIDVTYTVTHQTTQILPPAGPPKRSRREPQEAVRTASRWRPSARNRLRRPWARTKVLARKREQRPPCGATASLGEKGQHPISRRRLGTNGTASTRGKKKTPLHRPSS